MEVTCLSITPAKISSSSFCKTTLKEGILFLKKNAIAHYEMDKQWNKFITMEGL